MNKAQEKLHEQAKKNFRYAVDIATDQRTHEREDLEFQVPRKQWTEEEWQERNGGDPGGGLARIPARPTLSISKIDQPIASVLNQERNSLLGVNIHPISPDADDDRAKIYQGLYRQIERDSRAGIARSWAFNRGVKAGFGAYRITTRYADDVGGDPFDQRISIDRILHQDSVYFDPAAQAPDFSDAAYAFIVSDVPYKRFTELYPKSRYSAGADDAVFDAGVFVDSEWVTQGKDGNPSAVKVAEYFYRVFETEKLYRLTSGDTVKEVDGGFEMLDGTELPEDFQLEDGIKRERNVPKIKWAKMSGAEILEEADWAGKYIPIVVVLGHELIPFDEKRHWHGMIRPARDAQRLFNYAASGLVEMAALEPKAPYVGDPRQFKGFEQFWDQANTRAWPYLPANLIIGDKLLPPPARTQIDSSRLGPNMMLIQQADDFIQSTMKTYTPGLVQDKREWSGKAIEKLQGESDLQHSDYLHQMATVSMTYEAMVILDLFQYIYDRPGRIVRTRDDEENTSTIMLNQKFVVDPRNQQPVAFVEGQQPPPSRPPQPGQPPPPPVEPKEYNLKGGVYGVSVTIGKAYPTRMAEGHALLARVTEAMPNLADLVGPELFEYSDFPGAEKIAEMLRKLRNQKYPFLAKKEGEEGPSKEEAEAKATQLEQQMKQMGQQLQEAQKAQETDMAKQQATVAKAKLDSDTRLQMAQIKAQSDSQLAQMKAQSDAQIAKLTNLTRMLVARMESRDKSEDREHKAREKVFDTVVDLKKGDLEAKREGNELPDSTVWGGPDEDG